MACVITYNNKKYTQQEFNEYFKSHFFEFAGDFLGSKQDIQGFKEFVNKENNKEIKFNLSEKSNELKKLPNNQWFNRTIQPIINRFSKMFPNVRVNVISINEIPKEVQAKVDGLGKQINSFYHKGQVYIIKERVSKDITIEEFLHPFVNALEKDNPELYKSLLGEAKQLFPELKEQIFQDYDKVYSSIFDKNREFLTQALTKKVSEFTPEQFLELFPFLQKRSQSIRGGLHLAYHIIHRLLVKEISISTYGLRYGTLLEGKIKKEFIHGKA